MFEPDHEFRRKIPQDEQIVCICGGKYFAFQIERFMDEDDEVVGFAPIEDIKCIKCGNEFTVGGIGEQF